jgi:regulatory protein
VAAVTALRRIQGRRPGAAAGGSTAAEPGRPHGGAAAVSSRIEVEVDGAAWLVLEEADVLRLGLHAGRVIDPVLAEAADEAARMGAASRRAGRLLARRGRSRAELAARLEPAAGEAVAGAVVERLEELGVVDDRLLAQQLAEHRLGRGFGPEAVRHLLGDRGVDEALVAEVVGGLDPEAVLAAARRAVAGLDGAAAWRRLASRGFDPDVAEAVLGAAEPDVDAVE